LKLARVGRISGTDSAETKELAVGEGDSVVWGEAALKEDKAGLFCREGSPVG
jgi:hypothetical protein